MAYPIRDVVLPAVLSGRTNGRLPTSVLVATPGRAGGPVVTLVEPAARGWRAMEAAAAAAGIILQATSAADSYRTYAVQESTFRARYTTSALEGRPSRWWNGVRWYQKPGTAMAAVPGTSNHGLAIAVDVANASGARLTWLLANAERYGWSWELASEPWHIRYVAGDAIPAAVLEHETGDDMTPEQADQLSYLRATTQYEIRNWTAGTLQGIGRLEAAAAEDRTRDAATLAAVQALASAGGVDAAPIVAAIEAAAAESRQLVEQLQATVAEQAAELVELRQALAAGARAEAAALDGS